MTNLPPADPAGPPPAHVCGACGAEQAASGRFCGTCGAPRSPLGPDSALAEAPGGPVVRLVASLTGAGFRFIMPANTPGDLQAQLAAFDQGRLGLFNTAFGLGIGMSEGPQVIKLIAKKIISLGTDQVDDASLASLQRTMLASFPLCALGFSKIYGPRFIAIVNGERLSEPEFAALLRQFEEINHTLLGVGGRLAIKLFGRSVLGLNTSAASGSMIVITDSPARAADLRRWATRRPLRSDTIANQLKQRLTSVKSWVKTSIGMIDYTSRQLRQEVIVLDTQTQQITSTALARLAFEFGFRLDTVGRHFIESD
jgi:hypothetical protein